MVLLLGLACWVCGCRSPKAAKLPDGPHLRVLTYNVNWGGIRPDLAVQAIRDSGADIVCLQETTPEWENHLRQNLGDEFRYTKFRNSANRYGGGLGILARMPVTEVAYVPSETGWFDGWIVKFSTEVGPLQAVNVHLRPPISDSGSWISGYLTTGDDRQSELERFFNARDTRIPTLVLGDFNDGENSAPTRWLEKKGLINALPQFDRYSPTWKWKTSIVTLKRRMDHIFYPPELECISAQVIPAGASDHFPVTAVFTRSHRAAEASSK